MAVYKLIKLKRDYAANWTLRNPILSLGEPGYERDTGKLKIGDGVTPWVGLDYLKVDMDDVVIDPDDLADVLNDVLQGGFGIDIVYSDPSDTILIRTTGLATQSDLIALSGDVANLDSALIFRGITDPTQPNSAPTNPAPANGDMWISNAEGKIDGTWVNLSGQDIVVDQFMLYEQAANGWVLGGNAVGVDLSEYATKTELNNLQYQVNQNAGNISINYLDIQQNIVDILNLKNSTNNQQTQIDALIAATGHIHDQDIYDLQNADIVLSDRIIANSGRSDSRDDDLQAQINAISGATPPEVDLSVISGYVAANTASGVVVLGKADQNSDDIATLSGLIDGGLDFKGYIDPTATGLAPSLPINGDLWVSDSSGVIDNGWTCLGGQDVGVNQWMIYSDDDNCWQLGPATDIDLSAYALKTELDAVSGLVDQNADDIVVISGLLGSGIPSGLVEYSTGLAIRHGNTEVSVNEVSGNSVIDLTNWKIKDGHFIPNSNAAFDLGNAEYKVRHLFLSDNSIYMGSGKLSSQGNDNPVLLWEGEPLAKITDINTIISGELAEQKLLDLQDVTSDGPVEQYAVPVYDQASGVYKVKRLSPLEVEDTSTPPLNGYPAGSLGNELQDMKGDIQSNTILISGIAEDIVEIPDAVIFKGVTDPTVSGSAPAGPDNGDMWVSNNSGLIDGSWTGLSGEDVLENQFLLYSTGLNVWLKGGKIDVNDLSDQYLPLTGNLNPNDQKLDAVEFTSNVVTTSVSGLYPQNYVGSELPGRIGNLTYINHPVQSSSLSAQVYGPSEFNLDRSDYADDWRNGTAFGYDCISIGYHNEPTSDAGYSWGIKVGPPSRYFPSGIYGNGNTYPQRRGRDPNPMGIEPAFLAERGVYRGRGAFEFRPFIQSTTPDLTTSPYQIGFHSTPQNQISFDQVYAKDPGSTPTYVGFFSNPRQETFSSSESKGYALHCDFQAGAEYQVFGAADHGRVYGFYSDMTYRHGANLAGFIERGADFNQLQAPTVFGADTIYGGSNPFVSANIYKPTDQIDIAQGGIRIRNAKLVQESTSGNPGQIGWDQNGLLCYTSSSWKRAPLLRFTTTVSNPTPDSVALTVDGGAKLTATANDLQAFAGYVPLTDNSLLTKKHIVQHIVEPTLPIKSFDRTVGLYGSQNNAGTQKYAHFYVDIQEINRLVIDDRGRLGISASSENVLNYFGVDQPSDYPSSSCYGVYADGKCQDATTVYSVFSSSPEADARASGASPMSRLIHYQTYYDTGGGDAVQCEVIEQIGLSLNGSQFNVGNKNYGMKSTLNTAAGKENYHLYLAGNAPSYFGGQVQTDTVTSKAAASGDAAVSFINDQVKLHPHDTDRNLANTDYGMDVLLRKSSLRVLSQYGNEDGNDGDSLIRIDTGFNTSESKLEFGVGTTLRTTLNQSNTNFDIISNTNIKIATDETISYYEQYSNGYHVFQSNGSQSRFTDIGDLLIGTQTPFTGGGGLDATKTVILSTGKKGIARWSARPDASSNSTDFYLSCDYDNSQVVLNSNSQVVLTENDGAAYVPVDDDSLITKRSLTLSNLDDVEYPVGPNPVSNGEILIFSDINNKWLARDAGTANLGSTPLGGWPVGSVGEAISNAGGGAATLPISSVDNTVTLFGANDIFSVFNAGSESFIISADQHIGLGKTPANNVLLDGDTDQAFVYRFTSTNTGLYDGRMGTRMQNNSYGYNYIVEQVIDAKDQTYGFWAGNSGGSSPIIAGGQNADVLIRSTGPAADQFIKFDLPVISGKAAANMIIPSANSVSANLLIGGTGENPKDPFTICAKAGGSAVTNPQSVVWASHMNGDQYSGSAYFKLAHGDDGNNSQLSYWNLFAGAPTDITDASGVYERTDYAFRIAGTVVKSTDGVIPGTINYITCVESTDINHCKVQINRNAEFLGTVSGINISNLDDVEFPVGPNPVSANQILRYSTINNKWVNSNAGNAVLGSAPLGGWPVGSVGEAIANGAGAATLPITNTDGTAGVDFATGGAQPVTYMYTKNTGTLEAGSITVDYQGRVRTINYANNSASVSENSAFGLYSKVDKGTSRTGFGLRSTFWGDNDGLPSGEYSTINYLYGYYSNPLVRDANVLTSADFFAVGTQCLDNSSVTTQMGFFVPASYASQSVPPSGQDVVVKYGFRSDLPQVQDSAFNDKNFHIFTNGTAPSRFGSDVELTNAGRIVNASYYKDANINVFNTSARVAATGVTYLPTNASRINNNSLLQIENSNDNADYVGMSFYNRNTGGTSFSCGLGVRANANGVEGDSTFTITCREGGNTAIQTAAFSNDKVVIWKPLTAFEGFGTNRISAYTNDPGDYSKAGDANIEFGTRINFRTVNQYNFMPISGSTFNALNMYDTSQDNGLNVLNLQVLAYGSDYTASSVYDIGGQGCAISATEGDLALVTNNVAKTVMIGCGSSNSATSGPTLYVERSDVRIRDGLSPQTDYSLATKKYVDDATAGSSSSVVRGSVAATGTQTDFTVTEGYTPNQLDVYVNGVKMLDTTDYTAGDGSTIVLAIPAASGDIVQYTAYESVSVAVANIETGTPSSSSDSGSVGDIKHDDDYVWINTSAGWKKSPLYTYDQTPSLTIRVTQAEYDALTPDPAITYVIVG